MRALRISIAAFATLAAAWLVFDGRADAMPMFARKYKMSCSGCHDPAPPKLNRTGYLFRRAGFRMPENIGEEENSDFSFSDYFSGSIQARQTVSHVSDDTTGSSISSTSNEIQLTELSLYPVTGSFAKYFATEGEISLAPDENPEIENAYVRAVFGNKDLWVEGRAGIYHLFEGVGASDRPIGQSAPLFMDEGANQTQDTLVRLIEQNRVGAEVGVQWRDLSLTVEVNGRMNTTLGENGPSAAGTTPSTQNGKDLVIVASELLGERSSVSALYLHGSVELPVSVDGFMAGTDPSMFDDTYDRLALFGSVGVDRFLFLAAGEVGWDDTRDPDTGRLSKFNSWGAFGEIDCGITAYAVAFARYDFFDPSTSVDKNEIQAVTLGGKLFKDWVYLTPELQIRSTAGEMGSKVETVGFLHLQAIY